jgi:hypothetical protein
MKKVVLVLAVLVSYVSYGQNSIKLSYSKDAFTDKESLRVEQKFLVSDDSGKKGFILKPSFEKDGSKWKYAYTFGISTVGNCFENDKIYFIFDDGTKFEMKSWNDFNCKGNSSFDLYGAYRNELSKSIKAVKFVNGRSYDSFEKVLTKVEDKNYFINCFKALDDYNSKN